MLTVRASSTDRIMHCPPSAVLPDDEVRVDTSDPIANVGTAVHEYLAGMVSGKPGATGLILIETDQYVAKYGIDGDEFERLTDYGLTAWDELKHEFPNPECEQHYCFPLQDHGTRGPVKVSLSGHMDVLGHKTPTVRIVDWKGGWKSDAGTYINQMMAYTWLGLEEYPSATKATAIVIWLRDRSYDVLHFTREQLDAWAARLRDKVLHPGDKYSLGRCQYCPRAMTCPALRQQLRGALSLATDLDNGAALTPARLVELYQGLQQWARIDKSVREIIKAMVATGGDLVGDGHRITLSVRETDQIDPIPAFPVAAARLTESELASAISMPKTRLIKAVRDKVPKDAERGTKAAAERDLMGALRGAGAINKETSTSLALVKL